LWYLELQQSKSNAALTRAWGDHMLSSQVVFYYGVSTPNVSSIISADTLLDLLEEAIDSFVDSLGPVFEFTGRFAGF